MNDSFDKPLYGKIIDSIGTSLLMRWYSNSWFQHKISGLLEKALKLGKEDASEEFNSLGQSAQNDFALPLNQRLSIKKLSTVSFLSKTVGALTFSTYIYVNEDKLCKDQVAYGVRRCLLLHEAVHAKYNDCAHLSLCFLVSALSGMYVGSELLTYFTEATPVRIIAAVPGAVCLAGLLVVNLDNYMERRADIQGHYASKCFTCVQESADRRKVLFAKQNNALKNNGYLWCDDLEKISQDLKNQNVLCQKHN